MKLVTVNISSISLGKPLPFAVRTADGVLLASKGYVFSEREALDTLALHGTLYTDQEERRAFNRALASQMNSMVNDQSTTLGKLADSEVGELSPQASPQGNLLSDDLLPESDGPSDWLDMQSRANNLLRDPHSLRFLHRLDRLHNELNAMVKRNPDSTLFALIHLTASETLHYSATHAMLVCVMCSLAARDVLNWSPELEKAMGRAALTMNMSMTELQDHLTTQRSGLTAEQRKLVDTHPARSVELLQKCGVTDPLWLGAILHHHAALSGPLSGRLPAQQIARLIHRADSFAARLSPRAMRKSMTPSAAMQATYFDEGKKVDEAGASLIKAVGIYPPGSFVKLASNEIATVTRRGVNTLTPRVAVLVNRDGMPMAEPAIRDTRLPGYRIVASVNIRDIKVRSDLLRLLALT
jgi:HD-GYP domain-containing protein (c-di-GMP phosphodiesterase class II)